MWFQRENPRFLLDFSTVDNTFPPGIDQINLKSKVYFVYFRVLNSVESFNIHSNKWQKLAPLISARTGLSCARCKAYILVAGGLSEENKNIEVLSSVEKYDTRTDQ